MSHKPDPNKLINLTVDGIAVTVPEGTTILEAARKVNVEIPVLCYHPDLSVRLPWEAEWEYACRAGTQTRFNFGEELTLDKVNYRGTWEYKENEWGEGAKKSTADVKTYPCNAWGLYEMHGNVWEFTQDHWTASHLYANRDGRPSTSANPYWYVTKGGSWFDPAARARSAARKKRYLDEMDTHLRFRGVRGL